MRTRKIKAVSAHSFGGGVRIGNGVVVTNKDGLVKRIDHHHTISQSINKVIKERKNGHKVS